MPHIAVGVLCGADSGSSAKEPTTPRSVEACLRLGIDPAELTHIPFETFMRQEHGQADLANLLYTSAERLRQVRNRCAPIVDPRAQHARNCLMKVFICGMHASQQSSRPASVMQERLTLLVDERQRLVEAEQKLRPMGNEQRTAAAGGGLPPLVPAMQLRMTPCRTVTNGAMLPSWHRQGSTMNGTGFTFARRL